MRLSRAQRLLADFAEAEQPTLRSERITKLVWVVPSREEETQSVKSSCRRQVKGESRKGDKGSKGAWDKEINKFKEINGD